MRLLLPFLKLVSRLLYVLSHRLLSSTSMLLVLVHDLGQPTQRSSRRWSHSEATERFGQSDASDQDKTYARLVSS